jgi:hypothetical protein
MVEATHPNNPVACGQNASPALGRQGRYRRQRGLHRVRPANAPLVVETAAQLVERNHDVLTICRSIAQTPVPCLHVRNRWSLDVELEIPIGRGAGRDVRQRKHIATQEWPAREQSVEQSEMLSAAVDRVADGGPVSLNRCSLSIPRGAARAPRGRREHRLSDFRTGPRAVQERGRSASGSTGSRIGRSSCGSRGGGSTGSL